MDTSAALDLIDRAVEAIESGSIPTNRVERFVLETLTQLQGRLEESLAQDKIQSTRRWVRAWYNDPRRAASPGQQFDDLIIEDLRALRRAIEDASAGH